MPRVRGMHGQRLDNAVERVEGVVARVLRDIARTIASLVGASPSTAALSDDDLQPIRQVWEKAVGEDIAPVLVEAYAESARTLAAEFTAAGREVEPLSLDAPETADFIDAATNRLVGVSDTLWEVARKELADGVRAGEGVDELAARLREAGGFGEPRARTIARTEVVAAANAGSLAQALRLGDASMQKVWMDADDDRVRPAHEVADGQAVPVGEPFEVGGELLMYPGQPIGSAANVINERCGIGYSWPDDGNPPTAAGPDQFHLPGRHDQREHGEDGLNLPDSTIGRDDGESPDSGPRRDRASVGETTKKYGPKSLTLAAHEDGQLSLADGDGNQARLSLNDIDDLRTKALYSYDMEVDDEFTITNREERDGALHSTLRMLVQKTAVVPDEQIEDGDESYLRDTLAVHLAPNADPDFDELRATPAVEMTARELADLAEALSDLGTARRVDTGHGNVDMFSDGRSWVLRPADGPELRLNRRGFRTLDQALGAVVDAVDEEGDSRAERVIDTNIGSVTVLLEGGLGVGNLRIRAHDPDVEIVVAPARQSAFLRQMGLLSEVLTASAAQRRSVAMAAVVPSEVALTAAAEVHTGAMIALRPSVEDAERLAVEGGEPADQLHATLAYLGTAADIPPEVQQAIISRLRSLVEDAIRPDYDLPMVVDGFAVSMFNPPGSQQQDGKDRDSCVVLGLSGGDLDPAHGMVVETLREVFDEAGIQMPEQHAPWVAHATLEYTDDPGRVEELMDRAGPVTFDAIRVAFGGENTDIPLRPIGADDGGVQIAAPEADLSDRDDLEDGGSQGDWDDNAADSEAFAGTADVEEPAPDASLEPLPGEHFHTWTIEGVSTGLRLFAPGAITWRTPPFAFHDQVKSSAHGGVPETIHTGIVTRAERIGNEVHFWGRLDLRHPVALDQGRRIVEGFNRWSSVGADESIKEANIDVEYVLSDGDMSGDSEPEVDLMTFRQYRVAEITGVSVPALADALLEPTPELIATLTEMGVIDVSPAPGEAATDQAREVEEDDFAATGEVMPEPTVPTSDEQIHDATVIVAAGHIITIPDVPPAQWFAEPVDVDASGALTVTDEGRIYGYLAPAGIAHRSFRNRRVEVPRGNVDYSRWMGGEAIVAGGARVIAGPITMNCGHMPPAASSDPGARMEHYDNTCSVVAQAAIGENAKGVWIAGALLPGVTAEQVSRMLACRLSGDWAPHPERSGWREFVAALLVPVPGFPMPRSAPSTLKIAEGALVAAAVPVQMVEGDDMEIPMEMTEEAPLLVEGDRVRVVDPRDPDVTEGEIVVVHTGPAYALMVPGRDEPVRWYVAEELELAETEPVEPLAEPVEVEEIVASAVPDLRPVMEVMARSVGRDAASRMAALRNRVHQPN